ncbi:MAG TPA: M14 family metallopeptidase, partial [Quisquiliibacterium sp.]|nr:M14 family metallopeptidase [Quisquiliibacterium sp.]
RVFEGLPQGFLEADPAGLQALLGGPALIFLRGERSPELFISVMLHGNESTGLRAAQQLLRRHAGRALPRSIALFVGNVAAARLGLRRLDGQPDYNRIWPGSVEPEGPERALALSVTETMRARGVFACVDVHNNTGLNPHYGCVSRLDARTLQLAALFSRTAVYFRTPPGVLSGAFAEFAPAIAIECGKPGEPANDARAAEYLEACLHLSEIPAHPVAAHDLSLYHTVCTVRVPEALSLAFEPGQAALTLDAGLDHLNFTDLPAGHRLGRCTGVPAGAAPPLLATDEQGLDVSRAYFAVDPQGVLRLARPATPAMLTLDLRVVRQDCLCYLMERLTHGVPAAEAGKETSA